MTSDVDVVMNPHDERCENWVLWREMHQYVWTTTT